VALGWKTRTEKNQKELKEFQSKSTLLEALAVQNTAEADMLSLRCSILPSRHIPVKVATTSPLRL